MFEEAVIIRREDRSRIVRRLGGIPVRLVNRIHPSGTFKAISVGYSYACAIRDADGGIECWGNNNNLQASPPTTGSYIDIAASLIGSLKTADGNEHSLDSSMKKSGFVVLLMCNHCPYVKAMMPRVVKLQKEIVYHGRLDNIQMGLAPTVVQNELLDAIDNLIAGKPNFCEHNPSIGCSIKWKK